MIAKLREAKEQLSDLVKRAAGGEEIIITVRGQPMARLSSVRSGSGGSHDRGGFADELAAMAESVRLGSATATTQEVWDDLRQDRF
jgi:prevent-host-death family protein